MQEQPRTSASLLLACSLIALAGCSTSSTGPKTMSDKKIGRWDSDVVTESARQIPILYDVDVVVVGGTSGAVTAAVAAAEAGAKVFLAAPRPYLGDDICGTYRLWLEPDEEPMSPLAKVMFAEPGTATQFRNTVPFTYETDIESSSPHKDSQPLSGPFDDLINPCLVWDAVDTIPIVGREYP